MYKRNYVSAMRRRGKITKWNDERGFGFITPKGGGELVFVHIKAFSNRHRRPIGNEIITYEVVSDDKGRIRAERVEFINDTSTIPTQGWTIAFTIALLFFMFVGVSVFVGQLPFVILVLYLVTSAVSFFIYAHDKSAARRNQRRTAESTLHLLGVLGGWPGAFVAQQLFHHKSKKQSFQFVFWGTVVLNCVGLVLLFSGVDTLKSVLGATKVAGK